MRIILLATNETKKLAPLHTSFAAPMLPIVNRPVLATTVEMIARAGYKRVLISLCDSAGSIAGYLGSGSRWGLHIDYVVQREHMGTAGALQWASRLLDETVLVLPADAILDLDIAAALAYHRAHNGPVTAILSPRRTDNTEMVHCDDQQRVLGLGDLGTARVASHTGAYILEPEVLRHIPRRQKYDLYAQFLPVLLDEQVAVQGYITDAYWNPLLSFAEFQEAQQVFLYSAYRAEEQNDLPRVRYPSIAGRQVAPGVWVGRNHVIHPSVRIAPPICISDNCWIGQQAELGPATVIGQNVVVDNEATISNSTIADNTYVGQLVNVSNRIVNTDTMIDPSNGTSTAIVDPFLLGAVHQLASPDRRPNRVLTRLFVAVLLVVLSPLLVLLGLATLFSTGGRLFRREHCIGRRPVDRRSAGTAHLQGATLLVFETARASGTTGAFGGWLLRTDLYRLPMLWNVLHGDLALVGVKPVPRSQAGWLNEEWHQKRFEQPIGFTGLWYIQTTATSEIEEILVADAYYAATRTWFLDLRILIGTPRAWWRRMSQTSPETMPSQDLLRVDG